MDNEIGSLTAADVLSWLHRASQLSASEHDSDQFHAIVLEAITGITGLELSFVTELDPEDGVQRILASTVTAKDAPLRAGARGPLADALCLRSHDEHRFWTSDVRDRWADVADLYDLSTYVSVPIRLNPDGTPRTMLCAGSTQVTVPREQLQPVFEVFARLLAERQRADLELVQARLDARDAERRLRERLEFAAASEHAMKGPLTIIEGWVEVLTKPDADVHLDLEGRRKGLDAIGRAADRLLMQVEDLVTEVRTTLIRHDPISLPLHEIAADVVTSFHREPAFVTFTGRPVMALGDEASIRIVLEHLLENVLSHTPDGTLATVDTWATDDRAILRVEDDGPGLPADTDTFEAFTSTSNSSGLGLWIVRSVVDGLHGTITADRGDSGGARFTIALPLSTSSSDDELTTPA